MSERHDRQIGNVLDAAAERLAKKLGSTVRSHPTSDELVAYQEGLLETDRADQIRRHLVACVDCAEDVLRLDAYDEEPPLNSLPTPEESQKSWLAFQETARRAARDAQATSTATGWHVWFLAASLVLALVGISTYVLSLNPDSRTTVLDDPFAFDLVPAGEAGGRSVVNTATVIVPEGTDVLVPRLNYGGFDEHYSYRARLLDDVGSVVWRNDEVHRQPSGNFLLLIPRAEVSPGVFEIRLQGRRQEATETIAIYRFELRFTD